MGCECFLQFEISASLPDAVSIHPKFICPSRLSCPGSHVFTALGLGLYPAPSVLVSVKAEVGGAWGKAADGTKGGVPGDVSLKLISWALRPLGVGSRAG